MTTISTFVPCEQCKEMAFYYFDNRGDEIYMHCPACGFAYERRALIDRKHQAEDPDHRIFFKLTKDGHYIHRIYKWKGYGAYSIGYVSGGGVCGSFNHPITQDEIDRFKGLISQEHIIAERCSLTRWNEDTKQVEYVVGEFLPPYADESETELT